MDQPARRPEPPERECLQLDGVELVVASLPLRRPWRTAGGELRIREVVLARVVAGEHEGWGECAALPDPTYTGEYVAGAIEVMSRHLVPRLLATRLVAPLGAASRPGATAALAAAGVVPALAGVRGHPMAVSALEMAVLDLELRATGRSLGQYLGVSRHRVPAGVAVGLAPSIDALVEEVAGWVAQGYQRVKLEVAPGWDLEPVAAVRTRWPDLALQVDANGAYAGLADAAARLRPLDEHRLLLIEQPLADHDLVGHAALARQLRTPLCLDEAIGSVADLDAALALSACRAVNIKPGRVGGYLAAVSLHDRGRHAGVDLWCGGMLETGLARSANIALAALPGFTLPGDLSASDRFFAEDLTEPVLLAPGGWLTVPDGPGVGPRVREEALRELAGERRWFSRQ